MKDITEKGITLRVAVAQARISMPPDVQARLRERRLEKGDALEIGRMAGIMAAKKTWEIIPLCHPLALTGAAVEYEFVEDGVIIRATVKTRGRTGVEMEALAAASVTALTLYDMLKPYTHALEISGIHLVSKTGGKSGDYRHVAASS